MAVDAGIPLGVKPMQLDNPTNALAQMMQLRGMQQDQALGAMKMDEYRRGLAEENVLRDLTKQSGGDMNQLSKLLYGAGNYKQGMAIDKSIAERKKAEADLGKTGAETEKLKIEGLLKKTDFAGQLLSAVQDQPSYEQARSAMQANGLNVAQLPPQFDPAVVGRLVQQSMSIKEQLAAKHQALTFEETRRHNSVSEGLTAQGQQITMRGQNMADARSREANQNTRGQIVETDNGFMLADPRAGTAAPLMGPDGKPLKGKAANRQLTDSQAKANLFGSRMAESHRILTDLEGKYSPMGVNAKMAASDVPLVGGAAGYAGNLMLSESGQQAEQAQRDFINAVLRRESGAVITKPEFANGQKQYFPQPGDGPQVLAQKKRNRELAIQGMAAEVPNGLRSAPSLTNPGNDGAASGGWKIEKVQ
jgi:hypothetical protein